MTEDIGRPGPMPRWGSPPSDTTEWVRTYQHVAEANYGGSPSATALEHQRGTPERLRHAIRGIDCHGRFHVPPRRPGVEHVPGSPRRRDVVPRSGPRRPGCGSTAADGCSSRSGCAPSSASARQRGSAGGAGCSSCGRRAFSTTCWPGCSGEPRAAGAGVAGGDGRARRHPRRSRRDIPRRPTLEARRRRCARPW